MNSSATRSANRKREATFVEERIGDAYVVTAFVHAARRPAVAVSVAGILISISSIATNSAVQFLAGIVIVIAAFALMRGARFPTRRLRIDSVKIELEELPTPGALKVFPVRKEKLSRVSRLTDDYINVEYERGHGDYARDELVFLFSGWRGLRFRVDGTGAELEALADRVRSAIVELRQAPVKVDDPYRAAPQSDSHIFNDANRGPPGVGLHEFVRDGNASELRIFERAPTGNRVARRFFGTLVACLGAMVALVVYASEGPGSGWTFTFGTVCTIGILFAVWPGKTELRVKRRLRIGPAAVDIIEPPTNLTIRLEDYREISAVNMGAGLALELRHAAGRVRFSLRGIAEDKGRDIAELCRRQIDDRRGIDLSSIRDWKPAPVRRYEDVHEGDACEIRFYQRVATGRQVAHRVAGALVALVGALTAQLSCATSDGATSVTYAFGVLGAAGLVFALWPRESKREVKKRVRISPAAIELIEPSITTKIRLEDYRESAIVEGEAGRALQIVHARGRARFSLRDAGDEEGKQFVELFRKRVEEVRRGTLAVDASSSTKAEGQRK